MMTSTLDECVIETTEAALYCDPCQRIRAFAYSRTVPRGMFWHWIFLCRVCEWTRVWGASMTKPVVG